MFNLICIWISSWINNRVAGDLRRYCAHYDVIVMVSQWTTKDFNKQRWLTNSSLGKLHSEIYINEDHLSVYIFYIIIFDYLYISDLFCALKSQDNPVNEINDVPVSFHIQPDVLNILIRILLIKYLVGTRHGKVSEYGWMARNIWVLSLKHHMLFVEIRVFINGN